MQLNKKKILCLGLSLLMLFGLVFSTSAKFVPIDTLPDLSKTGTVSMTLKSEESVVPGAGFSVYLVATPKITNGVLDFVYKDAFKSYGKKANSLSHKADSVALGKFIDSHKLGGTAIASGKTDKNGQIVFKGLPLGIYVIKQTGTVENYTTSIPVLASLPTVESGKWVYAINANPKPQVSTKKPLHIKVEWNDSVKNRPSEIEVAIKRGDDFIRKVVLSEKNVWELTVSDIEDSDDLKVEVLNNKKGYTISYKRIGDIFYIICSDSLIYTGQLKWPITVFGILGVVLICAGYLVLSKGKGKENA